MRSTLIVILALTYNFLVAQDIIYSNDDQTKIACKVHSINNGKIEYNKITDLKGPRSNMDIKNVSLVFLQSGKYFVPSEDGQNISYDASSDPGLAPRSVDLLIDNRGVVMGTEIKDINNGLIRYTMQKSVLVSSKSTNDVVAIIYAEGKHMLYADPSVAAPVLANVQSKTTKYLKPRVVTDDEPVAKAEVEEQQEKQEKKKEDVKKDKEETTKKKKKEKEAEVTEAKKKEEKVKEEKKKKKKKEDTKEKEKKEKVEKAEKKEEEVKKEKVEEKAVVEETATEVEEKAEVITEKVETETTAKVKEEEVVEEVKEQPADLSIDYEMFKKKALQKTEDLGMYLGIIANKETEWFESNKAIDQAVTLFVNEDAAVEVSSKSSPDKKNYKIRKYLERVKLLKYDKVEIEWTNISYVSDLKKAPDGNYYGVITVQQKFTGFIEGKVAYSDITRKNIEVVLKGYEKLIEGRQVEKWDVFLSDIGVVNTI